MMGAHTTYDSITKITTKEEDATGRMPGVQHQEHETGGILIEGEVGAPADGRRRRSTIQTRSVAAILMGAAILLVALTTMDFGAGIGSVGSMVSVRSSSSTDTDSILSASSQGGTEELTMGDYDYSYSDYSYSGYDDTIPEPKIPKIRSDVVTIMSDMESLEIWRNENGISGDDNDCTYCNYNNCPTGMPVMPNANPKCNHGNYMCQYYTNCGKLPGNNSDKNGGHGDASQCQKCYYYSCPTGRPSMSRDANVRNVCVSLHCPDYGNCEHDYPPPQGGDRVVWPSSWGKDSKSAKSDGVDEKTGKSSKGGDGASKKDGKSAKKATKLR